MKRLIFCLCIAVTLIGCKEEKDPAEDLYNLALQYAEQRKFDQAITVLQNIRINYEDSEYATKAEDDMPQYNELMQMMMDNQLRKIQTKFSRIHIALDNYQARFMVYPLTPKDLEKLPRLVVPEWDDVWGHKIHYAPTYSKPEMPKHTPDGYALASFGEDGLPGGEGTNRDHFFKNGQVVPQVTE